MTTKKFSISKNIMAGIEDTIFAAENYSGELRHEVLRIDKIELDEDNPRDFKITIFDIVNGLKKDDPLYERKQKERESLESLAKSINSDGLINPILVYPNGSKYKVLAGERRTLASVMAGKEMIHVRILDAKPDETKIATLQWIENIEREDLSLLERRENLLKLKNSVYKITGVLIGPKEIEQHLGCSRTQAYRYQSLIQADDELIEMVRAGNITNVKDLDIVSSKASSEERHALLEAMESGRNKIKLSEIIKTSSPGNKAKKRGGQPTLIKFGSTRNAEVGKEVIAILLQDKRFVDLKKDLMSVDSDVKGLTEVFAKILKHLEKKV